MSGAKIATKMSKKIIIKPTMTTGLPKNTDRKRWNSLTRADDMSDSPAPGKIVLFLLSGKFVLLISYSGIDPSVRYIDNHINE